jgi:NTE family protein
MPHCSPASGSSSPRLALVLGSGGVRSIAALGLVEVLARERLMPDLLVGCSAGAMFGALIAVGHSAEEAVRIAATLWSADVTRKRRWRAIPQMLFPQTGGFDADFALRDDEPVLQRLQQAFGNVNIEDLRLPLRVTTTDASTGCCAAARWCRHCGPASRCPSCLRRCRSMAGG